MLFFGLMVTTELLDLWTRRQHRSSEAVPVSPAALPPRARAEPPNGSTPPKALFLPMP